MKMKLFLIDAIGPFFTDNQPKTINWSKIPFDNLERNQQICLGKFEKVKRNFSVFVQKIATLGYNAVSLDDVAHLVSFNFYPKELKFKIMEYQKQFSDIFNLAKSQNLKIFLTTDLMFFNDYIENYCQGSDEKTIGLLKQAFSSLFVDFPIDGIILRMGEADGLDVAGDFQSKLIIKKPEQLNKYLKKLLPIFEKYQKKLIVRTWTVGAYPIGDLNWNKETYDSVFNDLNSQNLIVSMKYGASDFFRNLELNPLFLNTPQQKLIELQAKREYDGFGDLPYCTAWGYYDYYQKLKSRPDMAGIMVWCQTGGWSKKRSLTYLENSSFWTELNTVSTLKIFQSGFSPEEAIASFNQKPGLIEFLKKYNQISFDLMYLNSAKRTYYFRRLLLPPLLWIHWNQITLNALTIGLYRFIKPNSSNTILADLEELLSIGCQAKVKDIEYIYDTLKVFYFCRQALESKLNEDRLLPQVRAYQEKYLDSYHISINLKTDNSYLINLLCKIFIRQKSAYRLIDRLLLNPTISSLILKFIYLTQKNKLPQFVDQQAMGLKTLFR
jgi:hypothetical protein